MASGLSGINILSGLLLGLGGAGKVVGDDRDQQAAGMLRQLQMLQQAKDAAAR